MQHPKTKAYRLGPSIIAAGNAAFAQFPVLEYARPELEKLTQELNIGFGVTGRSKQHMVLLALYGNASPLIDSFQLGLRLPNTAPLAACFTAFSPAKNLEAWLRDALICFGFRLYSCRHDVFSLRWNQTCQKKKSRNIRELQTIFIHEYLNNMPNIF